MIRYKLTDSKFRTYGGCQWGENVTHKTSGEGDLCGPGWLHVYSCPEIAVLMNPVHANFPYPVLWKCRVSGETKNDRGLKEGWTKVTTLSQIKLPTATTTQRIAFSILCASRVYKDKEFQAWGRDWLSNTDRSEVTARRAASAAYAARAAAYAAYATATHAAYATATHAAAYAADAATDAAAYAAGAATAATYAADAAAVAGAADATTYAKFNPKDMAKKALKEPW